MLFFNVLPTPIPQEHPRTNFSSYHFENQKKHKVAPTHSNHGWPRSMLHQPPTKAPDIWRAPGWSPPWIRPDRPRPWFPAPAPNGRTDQRPRGMPRNWTSSPPRLMGKNFDLRLRKTFRLGVFWLTTSMLRCWQVVIMVDHSVQISSIANNIIYVFTYIVICEKILRWVYPKSSQIELFWYWNPWWLGDPPF